MNSKIILNPWMEAGWDEKSQAWIKTQLTAHRIELKGTIEQIHAYPWSTIYKIPTTSGNLFFKATAGLTIYEIPLSAALKELNTNAMPDLVATNPEAGWMMMRDGGKRLRETIQADVDWRYWRELLPQYAALQIQAIPAIENLLKLGLPDRSLKNLPRLFQNIISESHFFQNESEDALSDANYQRLLDLAPVVEEKSKELASYAIPETIHHGDLHDGNIFYDGSRYVFYDWGDICYSHPFFSLRTAYVSAEMRFGLEENSPELYRLREAYLPAWRDYASAEDLEKAFALAMELWAISSLFSWHQQIASLDAETYKDYQHILPSLAQELFDMMQV